MEFKIGDKVKITDSGETYSTYEDWVHTYVDNVCRMKWKYGHSPNTRHTFNIMVIAPHKNNHNQLAYIQSENDNTCYIIGVDGLEKISTISAAPIEPIEPIEPKVCDICGCVIEENDCYTEFDGKIFCENCADDELTRCDDCGELMYRDNATYLNDYDQYICEDCVDRNYYTCECCGELVHHYDSYSSEDGYICRYCADNYYYRCDNCGDLIHQDNVIYDEDSDSDYCRACWNENKNRAIHNYGYKPEPIFYNTNGLAEIDDMFIGIELEVDKGGHDNNNAQEILDVANAENEHIYIKHDGSLNDGFEIVSHPCTLEYHTNNLQWRNIMTKALELNYRSHDTDTCGLHIHISRSALGSNFERQEENIAKIIYFVEQNWNAIMKFTRRNEDRLNRWASRYGIEPTINETYEKAKRDYDRYKCVNLQNSNTIEFRMFRGTLKYSTFIATLQFVKSMCDFVIETDIYNWNIYTKCIPSEYTELIEYLKSKELM